MHNSIIFPSVYRLKLQLSFSWIRAVIPMVSQLCTCHPRSLFSDAEVILQSGNQIVSHLFPKFPMAPHCAPNECHGPSIREPAECAQSDCTYLFHLFYFNPSNLYTSLLPGWPYTHSPAYNPQVLCTLPFPLPGRHFLWMSTRLPPFPPLRSCSHGSFY